MVSLLDNYCKHILKLPVDWHWQYPSLLVILTRTVKRPGGIVKQQLMSRVRTLPVLFNAWSWTYKPIPLSHLRCASFDAPSESRREKSEEGGILDSLRYQTVEIFPFTIYHASNALHRRYTLFVASDSLRRRWRSMFEEALGIYRVRQEANMVSLIRIFMSRTPNWLYQVVLSSLFVGWILQNFRRKSNRESKCRRTI